MGSTNYPYRFPFIFCVVVRDRSLFSLVTRSATSGNQTLRCFSEFSPFFGFLLPLTRPFRRDLRLPKNQSVFREPKSVFVQFSAPHPRSIHTVFLWPVKIQIVLVFLLKWSGDQYFQIQPQPCFLKFSDLWWLIPAFLNRLRQRISCILVRNRISQPLILALQDQPQILEIPRSCKEPH